MGWWESAKPHGLLQCHLSAPGHLCCTGSCPAQPPGAVGTRATHTQRGEPSPCSAAGVSPPLRVGRDTLWRAAAGALRSSTSITTKFPTPLFSRHLLSIHFSAERLKWEYSALPESCPPSEASGRCCLPALGGIMQEQAGRTEPLPRGLGGGLKCCGQALVTKGPCSHASHELTQ